jgi:hypothetical protein
MLGGAGAGRRGRPGLRARRALREVDGACSRERTAQRLRCQRNRRRDRDAMAPGERTSVFQESLCIIDGRPHPAPRRVQAGRSPGGCRRAVTGPPSRCVSKIFLKHRAAPARPDSAHAAPDARLFRGLPLPRIRKRQRFRKCRAPASTAELPEGSRDRASGGPGPVLQCVPEMIPRTACPPQKFRWPLSRFHPSSLPDGPRRLLPRRPARHAVSGREAVRRGGRG